MLCFYALLCALSSFAIIMTYCFAFKPRSHEGLGPCCDLCKTSHVVNSHTSARQVLVIGNSNINKIGSREVFEHFHEPGSAVDGSSRSIHVFKSV